MKISTDKRGRRLYKFSSSVAQGGNLYAHKTKSGGITDKFRLKQALFKVSQTHKLIDVTIKVYDTIFFMFLCLPPIITPLKLINSIQEAIDPYGIWSEEYLWTGTYDLQEKYVRSDLSKLGYDYDKG